VFVRCWFIVMILLVVGLMLGSVVVRLVSIVLMSVMLRMLVCICSMFILLF